MNELYESALEADRIGLIGQWMVDYLRASGRNPVLAGGLEADGQYHTGLIDYPIERFKILMGPDKSFRYYEDPQKFNSRVESMIVDLRAGWKPVPFIATDIWNDQLELSDGAHRAEALKRFGIKTYPTIFYFKNQQDLNHFIKQLD